MTANVYYNAKKDDEQFECYTTKNEAVEYKYYNIRYKKLENYVESERNLSYNNDSACFDICASISEPILLFPGRRVIVNTGVSFDLDSPMWLRVNDRSGLACKDGITTLAGIIDSDYRGEVMVCLYNTNSPLRRYVNIKDTNEVYVANKKLIAIVKGKEESYHINENFLNVCGEELHIKTPETEYTVPNGSMFRLNKWGLITYPYAYIINPGDRIAQMELPFPYRANSVEVSETTETNRGSNGFGSSGK